MSSLLAYMGTIVILGLKLYYSQMQIRAVDKDKILYLGDSENDNPAFEKSDISIGITRKEVKPLLKCKYLLHHKKLNLFLKRLVQNKMVFDPVLLQLNRNLSYK